MHNTKKKTHKVSDVSVAAKTSRKNKLIAVLVAFALIVTGYLLISASGAGFFAAVEPDGGTLSGNAKVVSDTSAYGGKAIQFTAPATTPPPTTPPPQTGDCLASNKCWPSAANTGYTKAPGYPGSLTNFSGSVQSNTTYSFKYFPGGLYIPAGVTNVTFIGCRFTSNAIEDANVTTAGDNITFSYSTFEPKPEKDSAPPVTYNNGYQYGINQTQAGKITVDHSEFWGWGNGIQFYWSTQSKPLTVKNSWFHDARDDGNGIDHTDAILSNNGGPNYMVFDHNTIVSVGNTNGLALQSTGKGYDHVTVTNNYFSGFGYTVNIGDGRPSTSFVFTGNTWGTDIQQGYQPLNGWGGSGNTWRGNKVRFVKQIYFYGDHKTSPVTAADDGKYWTPNGVSSTEYTGN